MNDKKLRSPNSNKKRLSTADIVLICVGLYVLIRTPWGNMNSFHYLLFFLYIFCMMMRLTNMRKQNSQKEKMQQEKAKLEMHALEENSQAEPSENEAAPEAEKTSEIQENNTDEKDSQP